MRLRHKLQVLRLLKQINFNLFGIKKEMQLHLFFMEEFYYKKLGNKIKPIRIAKSSHFDT